MTRINVGIEPKDLCDQHLIAEYRELPRLWNFKSKSNPPSEFKLGKGHVLWCSKYPGMLYDRFNNIVQEMNYRGFTVNYPEAPLWAKTGNRPTDKEIESAKKIVVIRINEKINSMKRKPKWTKRNY